MSKSIAARLACAAALAPCGARAQTVDYSALEQLFGEPVTLSVTGSPQRASDVPASMEIIDADAIRRSGARDLPTLLRHVVGVDVLQTSHDHYDVAVHGYNQAFSPRLLVLVDGRQVYADHYGFTPWSSIPVELEAIRQIEVVKGPNSALFGFNAVGGVINIVTYESAEDMPTSASAIAGTQGLRQVSAVSGWHLGERSDLRAWLGSRRDDDFSTPQPADALGTRRGNERDALSLKAMTRLGDTIEAHFEGTFSDVGEVELGPVYSTGFSTYETHSLKAHLAAETKLGLVEGVAYSNDILAKIYPDVQTTPLLRFDEEVTVAQARSLSKIGTRHTLRLSAEYRTNALATTPVTGAEVAYNVASLGAMWELRLGPNLTLTNAVRGDRLSLERRGSRPAGYGLTNDAWNRTHSTTSFNSGVVWHSTSRDALRAVVSRGVQVPNLFNLGGLVLPAGPLLFVTGNPALEPTVVTKYELGWDRSLPRIGGTFRMSVFDGTNRQMVANVGGSDLAHGFVSTPANIGSSRQSGVEMSVRGGGSVWRWGVGYVGLDVSDNFEPFTVASSLVDFEHTTPRNTLNANTGWSRGPWEVDGYLRYQSRTNGITVPSSNQLLGTLVPIAAYTTVDARLAYKLDKITFALSGQGLTHSEQRQTSAPMVERRLLGTVEVDF
ncbi:MAG TPA: TonB-dependent receptor [Gammaproteobacteria bacterium]|nr:TonB-dependent receptor [Gammaproteobacteria bacterium]